LFLVQAPTVFTKRCYWAGQRPVADSSRQYQSPPQVAETVSDDAHVDLILTAATPATTERLALNARAGDGRFDSEAPPVGGKGGPEQEVHGVVSAYELAIT
jgi:hypothetical protein